MVKKNLVLVFAAIVGACVLFFLFYGSEDAKVKKQFSLISERMEKEAGENPIVGGAKIKQISKMLSDPLTVQAPAHSLLQTMPSQEVYRFIYAKRLRFETLSVDFYDVNVEVIDKTTARTDLTAVLKGVLKSGEVLEEAHEFEFSLSKIDDNWIINSVEVIEVLER